MVNFTRKPRYDYADLLEIIRLLRSPEGCPWDKAQTHASIRRGLLEESYEAAEAIDLDDAALLQEGLGDVLMQVVFHADIEKDRGRFTMEDVVDGVVKKLLYRHPHVFGSGQEDSPQSVSVSWDKLKRAEKGQKTTGDAMDSVARSLPGLWRAEKLQKKAADAGFDFKDISGALQAGGGGPGAAPVRGNGPGRGGGAGRCAVRRREGGPLCRGGPGDGHSLHLRKIHPSVPGRGERCPGPPPGDADPGGNDGAVEPGKEILKRVFVWNKSHNH